MKYRKKPVVIEAVKFEGFRSVTGTVIFSERPDWLDEAIGKNILFFGKPDTLTIVTLEGNMIADVGDYIIRGIKGELYPCKPDVFPDTYTEAVQTIPNYDWEIHDIRTALELKELLTNIPDEELKQIIVTEGETGYEMGNVSFSQDPHTKLKHLWL